MAQLPTGIVSHSRKVCSLYKKVLRTLEDWNVDRIEYRYERALMRERFEKNRSIPDLRLAKHLLLQGEEEWFKNKHYQPKVFANSPGGVAYERVVTPADWVVDYWDPMEKAQYPKYFAKREELKKEYMEQYFKKYPEPKPEDPTALPKD